MYMKYIWLRAECIHAFDIIIDYGLNNIIVKVWRYVDSML